MEREREREMDGERARARERDEVMHTGRTRDVSVWKGGVFLQLCVSVLI